MYIDLLLLFLTIAFLVIGYLQGFVHQLIGLLALLGIVFFAQPLSQWIHESSSLSIVDNSPRFVLFLLVCIAMISFAALFRFIFAQLKKTPVLGPIDRVAGAVCGGAKGVVLALLIGLGFQLLPERVLLGFDDLNKDLQESQTVDASFAVLNWERFDALRDLRARFHSEMNIEERGPWLLESGTDRR